VTDVEQAVTGMLKPIYEEREDGKLEVRQVFRLGRRNAIAGSYVREGTILRSNTARVFRNGEMIHEGEISSLKRFDDDVREVANGLECGLQITGFTDFEEGDEVVAFHMERTR
jgi:translation initiation factor IF-2